MSEGLQAEMTLQESCLEAMRHMSVEVVALIDKTNELEARNAELQGLCTDMASHLREAERIHGDKLLPDGYITRMQELGIGGWTYDREMAVQAGV